jgi:hypothetical protein
MRLKIYLSLVSLICLESCATPQTFSSVTIAHDSLVESWDAKGKKTETPVKANETFTLSSPLSEISAPGRIPLLVVKAPETGTVQISLKKVEEWKAAQTQAFIETELDDLYLTLIQIIQDLRTKKVDAANAAITGVVQRYPRVASAHYVLAQVQVTLGDRNSALSSLGTALSLRPGFTEALNLRKKLEGAP